MARKYKNPSIVSGLSIENILSMDIKEFNKVSEPDLKKLVGRLVSAGNKRIRRMEEAGMESPALKRVKKSGGVISVKGKTTDELKTEFLRAKEFLTSKTSTIKGYKDVIKTTLNEMKKQGIDFRKSALDEIKARHFGEDWKEVVKSFGGKKKLDEYIDRLAQEKMEKLFSAYEKLKQLNPSVSQRQLKYAVMREIEESMTDTSKTPEDIALELEKRVNEIYEEESEYDSFTGVSGFF